MSRLLAILLLSLLIALQSGCALFMGASHDQTSRVSVTQSAIRYLYPDDAIDDMQRASLTRLELPLRVGVAFVPTKNSQHASPAHTTTVTGLAERMEAQDFVSKAVVLPQGSLTRSGGFAELKRLSHLHRLDAMVLLSYEQIVYTEDSALSLLDLTVIGAFVVPGHKNEVQTRLMATAVHVPSERYLFSASASHSQEQHATLIHSPTQIREAQATSLSAAADMMGPRLEAAVEVFKAELKEDATVQVAGGSLGWLTLLLAGFISLPSAYRRRR